MAKRLRLRDEHNFPLVMIDLVALRDAGVTILNRFADLPGDTVEFRKIPEDETIYSFGVSLVSEVAKSDE